MNERTYAEQLESLFMALGDKTRLRLLNLMVDGEVSVGYFTDILGDSQPKISRHLAYLRSSGLVNTRRDGKWIHYSIRWPNDNGQFQILRKTLESMRDDHDMQADPIRYSSMNRQQSITSVEPYMISNRREAHNDLEEFLL
jgi:ArsR family transcriptional regulator